MRLEGAHEGQTIGDARAEKAKARVVHIVDTHRTRETLAFDRPPLSLTVADASFPIVTEREHL